MTLVPRGSAAVTTTRGFGFPRFKKYGQFKSKFFAEVDAREGSNGVQTTLARIQQSASAVLALKSG